MNLAVLSRVPGQEARRMGATSVRAPRFGKLTVGVLELIEWAFQREKIGLDFDEIERETGARPGVGMEYLMMQQARLGCRVQGGGTSPRHHDADMVAAALASLPESNGGRRMAVYIAELARVGERPDCMIGVQSKCEPVGWRRCRRGLYAEHEHCTAIGLRWPSSQLGKKADGSWCRVRYLATAEDVGAARRRYLSWYGALLHLRYVLQVACPLTSFEISQAMPPRSPWKSS